MQSDKTYINMRKYIIALVLSLVAMAASAQRFKVGDIYYIVTSPGCVSVTGENDIDCYSGHVVIPKKVVHDDRTYVVNEIGPTAFAGCDGVTGIDIPSSVQMIGAQAFSGCSGLTQVRIPSSVRRIMANAFERCSHLETVTLNEGLQEIMSGAFEGCAMLSVDLPNSVTTIGSRAFYGCYNLVQLKIGMGLTSLGSEAFASSPLRVITCLATVPPSALANSFSMVAYSSAQAFFPESSLNAYKLVAGWKNFRNIKSHEAREIHFECDTVRALCVKSGFDTNGDGKITYGEAAAVTSLGVCFGDGGFAGGLYDGEAITSFDELQYFTAITEITSRQLAGNKALKSITLPPQLVQIGTSALADCERLHSIFVPATVGEVGDSAFYNCYALEEVDLSACQVTHIGDGTFGQCQSLTEVRDLDRVTFVGRGAFYNCGHLVAHDLSMNLLNVGDSAFYNCAQFTGSRSKPGYFIFPESMACVGDAAFAGSGVAQFMLACDKPGGTVLAPFWNEGATVYVPYQLRDSIAAEYAQSSAQFVSVLYNTTRAHAFNAPVRLQQVGDAVVKGATVTRSPADACLGLRELWGGEDLDAQGGIEIPAGLPFLTVCRDPYCFMLVEPGSGSPSFAYPYKSTMLHSAAQEPADRFSGCSLYAFNSDGNWDLCAKDHVGGVYAAVPERADAVATATRESLWGPFCHVSVGGVLVDEDLPFAAPGVTGTIKVDDIVCTDVQGKEFVAYLTFSNVNVVDVADDRHRAGVCSEGQAVITFNGTNVVDVTGIEGSVGLMGSNTWLAASRRATLSLVGNAVGMQVDDLTVTGPLTVQVQGERMGLLGVVSSLLTVDAMSTIKATGARGSVVGFRGIQALDGADYVISKPAGAVFDDYLGAVTLDGKIVTSEVIIGEDLGPLGDVNGDGRVNVSDVSVLVNMIVGIVPVDALRADVDCNGRVNVSDVSALINLILQ